MYENIDSNFVTSAILTGTRGGEGRGTWGGLDIFFTEHNIPLVLLLKKKIQRNK